MMETKMETPKKCPFFKNKNVPKKNLSSQNFLLFLFL